MIDMTHQAFGDELTISRRAMVQAAAAAGLLSLPGINLSLAYGAEGAGEAGENKAGNTAFIQICLRGGFDALHFIGPAQEIRQDETQPATLPAYESLRLQDGLLVTRATGTLVKEQDDAGPALYILNPTTQLKETVDKPLFLAARCAKKDAVGVAVVLNVGVVDHGVFNRFSHFHMQETMDRGGGTAAVNDGWLKRLGDALFDAGVDRGAILQDHDTNAFDGGQAPTFNPSSDGALSEDEDGLLNKLWSQPARSKAEKTYQESAMKELKYSKIAVFSEKKFGKIDDILKDDLKYNQADRAFIKALTLPFADFGSSFAAQFATAANSGWDTHTKQAWTFADNLRKLDDALAGFFAVLAEKTPDQKVVVTLLSEFGRRIKPNETGGADHGAGGVAIIVGHDVNSGVYGRWPDLLEAQRPSNPYGADNLPVLIDYRDVLAESIKGAWGPEIVKDAVLKQVFPQHAVEGVSGVFTRS